MFQQDPPPNESPSSASEIDNEFLGATSAFTEFIGAPDAEQGQGGAAPAGEVMAPEIPPEMVRAALGPTWDVIFNTIAKVRGQDVWRLDDVERKTLVEVWSPLVVQWLQIVGGGNAALVLAVTATGAVMGGKVMREKIEASTKAASSAASTKTPGSAASPASSASAVPASPLAPNDSSQDAYA